MSRIRITSLPVQGDIYLNGDLIESSEEILFNQLESITYQPDLNYFGEDGFTWNAYDGISYALDSATVSISVTPVNDAPDVQPIEDISLNEDFNS